MDNVSVVLPHIAINGNSHIFLHSVYSVKRHIIILVTCIRKLQVLALQQVLYTREILGVTAIVSCRYLH